MRTQNPVTPTAFEKAKVRVKQFKVLGISPAGLLLELDASVTPEGVGQTLAEITEGENACMILAPGLRGGGGNPTYPIEQ